MKWGLDLPTFRNPDIIVLDKCKKILCKDMLYNHGEIKVSIEGNLKTIKDKDSVITSS